MQLCLGCPESAAGRVPLAVVICVGTSAASVRSNLQVWWKSEGRALIARGPDGAEEDDEDEKLAIKAGVTEEIPGADEQEAIHALQSAEDHAAAKGAVKDLVTQLSPPAHEPLENGAAPEEEASPVVAPAADRSSCCCARGRFLQPRPRVLQSMASTSQSVVGLRDF